jgi:ElaA protein
LLQATQILIESSMTLQWQTLSFDELSLEQMYAILRLRQQVFVVEQCCAYQDLDNLDQRASHILCLVEGQLAAYQRCLGPGLSYPESSLGRIVVCPTQRGLQLGRELVQRGIDYNLSKWAQQSIRIKAQSHLQNFYGSLGFISEGAEFLEDNIPHREMRYRAEKH